mmetsp:Transcript_19896/g.41565  ORF Transcript_19896/g.41565 Transcript_19896/m.41565 type:complete len:969 (-) Transcript_19896:115-3021(-)|eukprot:CAMPEP_0118658976 /NCGR_PEP_ID=MMETSP0785-20121206/14857_1 /TAXON_ID=91992 /ORGANISM="Bolidomonas pacifica, Strain CCMP 1866" /LENGTH=968 /DNA_ID=CAMNT_0006552033 /DNA_START=182 /DNA_END=3088 /DNA_ORIENTATION=-
MSDSEDDYEYHYSDSDDDAMDTPGGGSGSSLSVSAADADFAMEKRFLRESPKSQKPWVDFCISILRTVSAGKEAQSHKWFDTWRYTTTTTASSSTTTAAATTTTSTSTTTTPSSTKSTSRKKSPSSTTPSKTLANSYLMVDYDVPDLHSVTITIIDGRDEVRGVMRMTVPWPDIKDVNTEQMKLSDLSVNSCGTSPRTDPDSTVLIEKRSKQCSVKFSELQNLKILKSPWKGTVTAVKLPTRKHYHAAGTVSSSGADATWKMIYYEGDKIMSIKSLSGCPMDIIAEVDGEVKFLPSLTVGSVLNVGDKVGDVDVVLFKAEKVKSARKAHEEKKAKDDKDRLKKQEERMIYPTVPPKVEWLGPRLPFAIMSQIIFLPELQPDRWNICTSLDSILKQLFKVILESPVVDPTLVWGDGEQSLLKLVELSSIYASNGDEEEDGSVKLASFGVSKTFALADGKGDDAHAVAKGIDGDGLTTKKRKLATASERGFAKGTGYSGDARNGGSNMVKLMKGKQQLALELLRDLFDESVREKLSTDTLLSSVLPTFALHKLQEGSWMLFEKEANDYMFIVLWGGELFQRLQATITSEVTTSGGRKPTKKELSRALADRLLPFHTMLLKLDDEWSNMTDFGRATKKVAWKTWISKVKESRGGKGGVFTSDDLRSCLGTVARMIKAGLGSHLKNLDEGEDNAMYVDGNGDANAVYKSTLGPVQVDMIEKFTQHAFLGEAETGTRDKKQMKRLVMEFRSFSDILPLELHGAIFVRWSETQCNLMKLLIIAPADTPYGGGVFCFDISIPASYPAVPCKCLLVTTGGGQWRFNPNLYDSGKVCLSLLGTWSGEPWDPNVSNLAQVAMSIYGLIFVEEPFFNEPGYQGQRGTPEGDTQNRRYNTEQRYKTMQIAMLGQLTNPDPCFGVVIAQHFHLRKDDIIARCKMWRDDLKNLKLTSSRVPTRVAEWDAMIRKIEEAILSTE